jgi:hypothetical protein
MLMDAFQTKRTGHADGSQLHIADMCPLMIRLDKAACIRRFQVERRIMRSSWIMEVRHKLETPSAYL